MRAASLLGVFLLGKILALPIPLSGWSPIAYFWQDVAAALVFGLLDWAGRRSAAWSRAGWLAYAFAALLAAVNVPITRALGTPLTWPMARAARGPLADSIRLHLTWANGLLILLMIAAAATLPLLFRRVRGRSLAVASAGIFPVLLLGPWATTRLDTRGLERNALAALITGAWPRVSPNPADQDWRAPRVPDPPSIDLRRFSGAAAGRNLILVSLESAGAQYLGLYGAEPDLMPNLTKLAANAIVFENAYAVYPESIKGLFSLLCSTYPAFDSAPELYERVACRSLAEALAGAGYRTALFHSGRFVYLGMNSVIRNRGYHYLEDAGDIGGNHNSSFGVDEPSTVRRILAWIDSLPAGQRFFVTYLPIAGHHPYETPERGPFSERQEIGRYRNALLYGDASLGELARGLSARGLEDQTLWVLFGDHGEAFGQHEGNYGHTFFLYEENVRVPFLAALPGRIQGQTRARGVVSLVDVAPTILDLMGLPAAAGYQGRTALDPDPRLALFFTDYSLGLLGLRDGPWKLVHELESGRSKLFDLQKDPRETRDLAASHRERVGWYVERLKSWSAAQRHRVLQARGG